MLWLVGGVAFGLVAGCVEQTMEITTDPPGALVILNDQEVGRSPLKRDFIWYGNYDVQVRKEGYETLNTHKWLYAPSWNWAPVDLFWNLMPVTMRDHQKMHFTLVPRATEAASPAVLIDRAEELRGQMEGSQFTRKPMPTTYPATGPTTRMATPTTHPVVP